MYMGASGVPKFVYTCGELIAKLRLFHRIRISVDPRTFFAGLCVNVGAVRIGGHQDRVSNSGTSATLKGWMGWDVEDELEQSSHLHNILVC